MPLTPPATRLRKLVTRRRVVKMVKRVVPITLAAVFIPWVLAFYLACGLIDALRNRPFSIDTLDRYFFGNGVFTWMLSPFNLVMDLLTLGYRNKGVYRLEDLPPGHQAEIQSLIRAAHARDLVGMLAEKMGDRKRGMFFFRWYGKKLPAPVEVPEFSAPYKYIRTVGVSVFNKRQSTGKHFGPLRVTLRVLYNVNPVDSPEVYVKVGGLRHRWRDDGPLFVFDDTLQHQSVNNADAVRYCLFIDILRPSYLRPLLALTLTGVRLVTAPFRAAFYKHWTIIK